MPNDVMVLDVSQDWEKACDVQQGFMGRTAATIDSISYDARCQQVRALGGDCYDFLPLAQNHLAFVVGDACGKSVAAALTITSVLSSVRTAASFAGCDAASVIDAVNRQVSSSSLSANFATLFYGVIDITTRILRYVNAGHNPPLIFRLDGSIHVLDTGGVPVGIFSDWSYEEGMVQLHAGDTVVAYTDGVIEAVNPDGREWGIEGVKNAVVRNFDRNPADIVDAIFRSLDDYSREALADDATVAAVRIH